MLSYKLKSYTDKIFTPLIEYLYSKKIKSNTLTLISFIFSLLALINFFRGMILTGFVFALLDYLLDLLDGPLSRRQKGMNKDFGFFWDCITDHVTRNLWVFALAYSNNISYFLASLSILSYFILLTICYIPYLTKMKYLEWLPCWTGWILLIGLVTPYLTEILYFMVYLNLSLALIHFSYILYTYRKELI